MGRAGKFHVICMSLFFLMMMTFFRPGLAQAEVFILDEESVFCLYYRLSGKKIDRQDIEDLCFKMGRPLYSGFKPSELFVKNSQNKLRKNLLETISHYNEESVFKWTIRWDFQVFPAKDKAQRTGVFEKEMPQPTPYIMSKISLKGRRALCRLFKNLPVKDRKTGQRPVELEVYLKPERIEYHFEKRNIALEDVTLPLRYVVFQPIKAELVYQGMKKCINLT